MIHCTCNLHRAIHGFQDLKHLGLGKGENISLGESHTILSAYTKYKHLGYYWAHLSIYSYLSYAFPHNDTFWHPWETSLLKTLWEKKKLIVMSNFSFSPHCFLPIWITFCHLVKFEIVVCKLFQTKICHLVMG